MNAVLAGFDSRRALERALEYLAAARVENIETYTPAPFADAPPRSPLPLIMFLAGMGGFIGFFSLMAYADVVAYPLNIGGRPRFAWPTFVPIAFELGVLCAMVCGFVGYFVACRMPRLYDSVDECESFKRASRDGWFVAVRAGDAQSFAAARAMLESLQPASIEEFEA